MNIVSRLIGVGTFAYVLLMFCLLIARTKISVKALLGLYTAVLATMGFFYEPYITADLYRIREMMVTFAAMELPAFCRTYVVTSAVPVARLLYWAVGRTGVLELMPAIAVLVSYGCAFHILADSARRFESSRENIAIALFFLMSVGQYMSVVSNIRTMMALALICFCLYRETVEDRRSLWHWLLYAAAAGIHTVAVPVLAIRLILPVLSRKVTLWKRVLVLIAAAAAGVAVVVLVPNVVDELLEKVNDYIFGDRYSYMWEYLISAVAMGVQIYALYIYYRKKKPGPEVLASVSRMLALCVASAVVFCFEFSIFHRLLTYIAPLLTTPLLLAAFRNESRGRLENRRTLVLAASLVMLALSCSRGSLCSFKFY